jgi:flavin reductase (DIM6/NTAB) family NADH-FMN oxidoreductase RutF
MTAEIGAATVNWVTQGSFAPPLVVVGVKADSGAHTAVKGTGRFALCWARVKRISPSPSKPAKVEGGKLSGQAFHAGTNGAPILDNAITSPTARRKPWRHCGRSMRNMPRCSRR